MLFVEYCVDNITHLSAFNCISTRVSKNSRLLAKMATKQRLQPLQNAHFGSKIKMQKNMLKRFYKTLQLFYAKAARGVNIRNVLKQVSNISRCISASNVNIKLTVSS